MHQVVKPPWGAASHVGGRRKINEDAYLAQSPIFVVADGMGGHQRGEVASAIAAREFATLSHFMALEPQQVDACFERAATTMRATLPSGVGGTTVCGVAIVLQDGAAYWLVFNLGDSRAYHLDTAGKLTQISVDHSVVQELIDVGVLTAQEAQTHAERHVITRALETLTTPEPDYWLLPIAQGDQILLCSDGLTNELSDEELGDIWRSTTNPQQVADNLVQAANNAGGRDNITVVVVTSDAAPTTASLGFEVTRSGPPPHPPLPPQTRSE